MTHPLDLFRYCPRCGSSGFVPHDERSKRCTKCGFTYYHNAAASTVAVIENEHGELLVARRALEPARGTLDLPGGFVNPGESVDDGCRREVSEETGLEVTALDFLFSLPNVYEYSGFSVDTTDCFFHCKVADTTHLHAADDAASLQWIPWSELRPEDFGLHSIRLGIERLKTLHETGTTTDLPPIQQP